MKAENNFNSPEQVLNAIDKPRIVVGTATCGRAAGAMKVLGTIRDELKRHKIDADITEVGCIGLCFAEPLVDIIKPGKPRITYGSLTPQKVAGLIEDYLINDNPRPDLALGTIGEGNIEGIPRLFELPVFKPQVRITLRHCGHIDPEKINDYISVGGYKALEKVLADMTPEQVIDEIRTSGLRGRGGAGFPTATKWQFCQDAPGDQKYLICNADEGDPGAFMDRSMMEGDPHSVIEGMAIAAYAIGATEGYIYIRAEYPLAVKRVKLAIKEAEERGFLGKNISVSNFSFNLHVMEGAGAFVCGEETALMASIEGKLGMPRPRPPFPAQSGLWEKPTNINNAKTLATVPIIIQRGGKWYSQFGTEKSKGTNIFALTGKITHMGLVEVPMGTTLYDIIHDIGGGVPNGKKLKAVQTGGPSGGCIPANMADLPIDYESLTGAGSIMGSGGLVVMDEDTCMVDIARYFLSFTCSESCGKCVPCRLGTKQMLCILENICSGKGKEGDIELLEDLAQSIKASSLCGLGQTAPNPVLTTIRYFRDEYEEHISRRRCRAATCKELVTYSIINEKCPGCGLCIRECPVGAITFVGKKKPVILDETICTKCGACYNICRLGAVKIKWEKEW
ncbi:MAG: NADH-quinone oxidoreductase subunit NuoF [Chloroflexota bacterium]